MISPDVELEIGDRRRTTRARVVEAGTEEDALARRVLLEKYTPRYSGELAGWGRNSLAIAIDWPG